MKRLISFALTMFPWVCVLLATERRAMAYVDPGSGLLALQSFASVMAAVGFFLRRRIMGLFKRDKPLASVAAPIVATPGMVRKDDTRNAA
jgi:hypothetical protein